MDDPNEPYSDIDEELMAMDVPEQTKPSPEPSKSKPSISVSPIRTRLSSANLGRATSVIITSSTGGGYRQDLTLRDSREVGSYACLSQHACYLFLIRLD